MNDRDHILNIAVVGVYRHHLATTIRELMITWLRASVLVPLVLRHFSTTKALELILSVALIHCNT